MPIIFTEHTKQNNRYGPTNKDHYYQPAQYHNATAKDRNKYKSLWIISEPHQYCIFEYADENEWYVNEFIVGLNVDNKKKLLPLGQNNEKIAIFRSNDNAKINWHGYPIKAKDIDNSFDEFFCRLKKNNIISKAICKRLVKNMI